MMDADDIWRWMHELESAQRLADERLAQMTADRKQAIAWRDDAERLRAAVQRQVDNIHRWRATGMSASQEESQSIYEQLFAALNNKVA